MNENGKNDERQISSVDILHKSGLSRATLNNYIKMGILPHPIVKRPVDPTVSKAKQMGYFPYSVLDTLDRIIQYKREGFLMKEISILLTQKSIGSAESIPEDTVPAKDTEGMVSQKRLSDYGNENEELFPFMETGGHGTLSADTVTKRDTRVLFRQGKPMLLSFSILAAGLQNAAKICAELPPEEYFSLIRRIWKSTSLSFKKHLGGYGKHTGNGIVFYFLQDRDSSYLMSAIVCALELSEMMKTMSHEWKMSRGFLDDLYLNIGISEGQEFIGTVAAAPAAEIISLGDSLRTARLLSGLACSGSVWTTKDLLNRLDEKDKKKIRYGIYRKEQTRDLLVENVFSRVMDLIPQNDPKYGKYMDIGTLPVTEIRNLR
jgi:hypothetical protein